MLIRGVLGGHGEMTDLIYFYFKSLSRIGSTILFFRFLSCVFMRCVIS